MKNFVSLRVLLRTELSRSLHFHLQEMLLPQKNSIFLQLKPDCFPG